MPRRALKINEEVAQIKPIVQTGRLSKDSIRVSILSMFKGPKDVACVRALMRIQGCAPSGTVGLNDDQDGVLQVASALPYLSD
jgi:hypothetical protein